MDATFNLFDQVTSEILAVATAQDRSCEPFGMPVSSTSEAVVSGLVAPTDDALRKVEGATNGHVNVGCRIVRAGFTKVSAQVAPISVLLDRNQQAVKLLPQAWKLLE
jgi:hypothetical protein